MPYLEMWQGYQMTLLHTRSYYAKLNSQLADLQSQLGNVGPVICMPCGLTDQLRRDSNTFPIAAVWRQTIG